MRLYMVCGLAIESSIDFPELPPCDDPRAAKPICRIAPWPAQNQIADLPSDPVHEWRLADGRPWMTIARGPSGYALVFPGMASFLIDNIDGDATVFVQTGSGIPAETIRHLCLDQVLPLILSRHLPIVLHASAVVGPTGAFALAGESGSGKSTLAARCTARGWPVLTDDCCGIDFRDGHFFALPSYPGVRLWPDAMQEAFGKLPASSPVSHYSRKRRVTADAGTDLRFIAEGARLSRIYVLAPPEQRQTVETVCIREIAPADAFIALVTYSYQLDIGDEHHLKKHFGAVSSLVAGRLVRRLEFPNRPAVIPSILSAIVDDLSQP